MTPGVIARAPNENPRFVPLPEEILTCCLADVTEKLRECLCSAFGWNDKEDIRVTYKERDLDEEDHVAFSFVEALGAGLPLSIRIMFRLLGGKGGFGALLRKQMGQGKKTTNFDSLRDLSGRRLRHSKAVDRIKEWMEKKKREDDLVNLLTGEGPELPKPTPESESLDPAYVEKLKRTAAQQTGIVRQGMRTLDNAATSSSSSCQTQKKRAKLDGDAERGLFDMRASFGDVSSPSSDHESDDSGATPKAGSPDRAAAVSSSSACAAASSSLEVEEEASTAAASSADASVGSGCGVLFTELSATTSVATSCAAEVSTIASIAHESALDEAKAELTSNQAGPACSESANAAAPNAATSAAVADVVPTSSANAPENDWIVEPKDLADYDSPADLLTKVPLDVLKRSLQKMGLKCGGRPEDRAARFFLLKTTKLGSIPRSHFAAR